MQMTVYGPLPDLLEFMETFPKRYRLTTLLTGFDLSRVAFDYRGNVLMRLQTTAQFFTWPWGVDVPTGGAPAPAAAPAGAPGGEMMPGAEPGMEGGSGEAAPAEPAAAEPGSGSE